VSWDPKPWLRAIDRFESPKFGIGDTLYYVERHYLSDEDRPSLYYVYAVTITNVFKRSTVDLNGVESNVSYTHEGVDANGTTKHISNLLTMGKAFEHLKDAEAERDRLIQEELNETRVELSKLQKTYDALIKLT